MTSAVVRFRPYLPWTLAAMSAFGALALAQLYVSARLERSLSQNAARMAEVELRLVQNQLAQVKLVDAGAVAYLQRQLRDEADVRSLRIALLGEPGRPADPARAAVVWNPHTQSGILAIARLAPAPPGRAYVLWIYPAGASSQPLNAGVIPANGWGDGRRIVFSPKTPVPEPAGFAVSLEEADRAAARPGPLLLRSH
jgi:hypothetical protein